MSVAYYECSQIHRCKETYIGYKPQCTIGGSYWIIHGIIHIYTYLVLAGVFEQCPSVSKY